MSNDKVLGILCSWIGNISLRSISHIQLYWVQKWNWYAKNPLVFVIIGHTIPYIWIKELYMCVEIPFKQFYELWLAYLVDHSHGWHGSDQRQSKNFFFVKPIRNYYLHFCRMYLSFLSWKPKFMFKSSPPNGLNPWKIVTWYKWLLAGMGMSRLSLE